MEEIDFSLLVFGLYGLPPAYCHAEYLKDLCWDQYCIYFTPCHLEDIFRWYDMGFHYCTDDTQLYMSFSSLDGDDQAHSVDEIELWV